eukprot:3931913-Heterocapsa_arctica.AAC.1
MLGRWHSFVLCVRAEMRGACSLVRGVSSCSETVGRLWPFTNLTKCMDVQDAVANMRPILVDGQHCHLKPLLIIDQMVTNQPIDVTQAGRHLPHIGSHVEDVPCGCPPGLVDTGRPLVSQDIWKDASRKCATRQIHWSTWARQEW